MQTLKLTIAVAALAAFAAPVLAQTPAPAAPPIDTIVAIVEQGDVLDVMGMAYTLIYKPDGSYTDDQGSGGKWRADGAKLCITPEAIGQELCSDYPAGKKSGDKFEITSDFGPMTVTIK
ncbi:MAG: hypothetical protein Q8R02_22365 [Hyphomonadaceae bacterium]|nr:hypothetical protein [Hyphomonadaceae bacterium]